MDKNVHLPGMFCCQRGHSFYFIRMVEKNPVLTGSSELEVVDLMFFSVKTAERRPSEFRQGTSKLQSLAGKTMSQTEIHAADCRCFPVLGWPSESFPATLLATGFVSKRGTPKTKMYLTISYFQTSFFDTPHVLSIPIGWFPNGYYNLQPQLWSPTSWCLDRTPNCVGDPCFLVWISKAYAYAMYM